MDGQRLHPHLRRAAADGRRARRPLRPAAAVRHRPGHLHRRLRGRGARAHRAAPHPRPRRAGPRRRDRDAADPDDPVARPSRRERRALALGAWGGVGGLAVADRPGRRRRHHAGRELALDLLAQRARSASSPSRSPASASGRRAGPRVGSTCAGLALASAGLLGLVWGVIHGNDHGWTDPQIVGCHRRSASPASSAFVAWERRADHPMLPLHLFRSRAFAVANTVSLLMYFGMFGSIFLLSQFFQLVPGLQPVRGRPARPALDGDARVRGPDRRLP